MRSSAARIDQLSRASLERIVEPDVEISGRVVTDRPVVDRTLLSCADLDLDLSDEQWRRLASEEIAAITDAGIRFEALLLVGFGRMLADMADLTDRRAVYLLHELGEETRHSRMFIRLLSQLSPTADNPFLRGPIARIDHLATRIVLTFPALFCVMVLAGEEIPDLIQRRAIEHPGTDPFFARIARYHRAEEARHLAFARLLLPELWAEAGWFERTLVRRCAPSALVAIFDSLVHPGVYRTVGLPGWSTWRAARRSPHQRELRADALGRVASAVQGAGVFGDPSRPPRPWRRLVTSEAA